MRPLHLLLLLAALFTAAPTPRADVPIDASVAGLSPESHRLEPAGLFVEPVELKAIGGGIVLLPPRATRSQPATASSAFGRVSAPVSPPTSRRAHLQDRAANPSTAPPFPYA